MPASNWVGNRPIARSGTASPSTLPLTGLFWRGAGDAHGEDRVAWPSGRDWLPSHRFRRGPGLRPGCGGPGRAHTQLLPHHDQSARCLLYHAGGRRYRRLAAGAGSRQREGGMSKFSGKVVLVTGAGQGIGQATAERFLAEGAKVCAFDRDASGVEETVQALGSRNAAVEGVTGDISAART